MVAPAVNSPVTSTSPASEVVSKRSGSVRANRASGARR
jgi:hypothetical protein